MKKQTKLELTKIILGIVAGLTYLTGVMLKILHLHGAGILRAVSVFLLAGLFPFLFPSMYKKSISSDLVSSNRYLI